ncbi:MAG: helix-turn-helix transcriptional regulator [Alphaproteobacteria bacterium]|nr:helix-turn-helix transcriptional regulator [Alphaproteobacteria bacterium]MBT5390081.1 helix-turn-helix transcriptional regulator [Alphaproteobacteria bacterium]MBT5540540.1 helix-turn-helix transcriptional regulator [Alphaproteobacteria bacterium]MBT5655011.1 helix-turn-helix transcriptional regulator [Alphaproteobacteria bacterium]
MSFDNKPAFDYNLAQVPVLTELCRPLFETFGLTAFAHIKITNDGHMLRLATNDAWERVFYEKRFYNEHDMFQHLRDNLKLNESKTIIAMGDPKGAHCNALFDHDIWNTFSIYKRHKHFIEGYAFGTTRNKTEILDLYLNQSKYLKMFAVYFQDKAKDILEPNNVNKMIHLDTSNSAYFSNVNAEKLKQFEALTNTKKIIVTGKKGFTSLTRRETECLESISNGLSTKEIANHLGLSTRTIEYYVNNIKTKTQYKNKSDLISIFKNSMYYESTCS